MRIYENQRLQTKFVEYYAKERDRGFHPVAAKYNASYQLTLYLLGIIEHYSEWDDLFAIKEALHHYRYLELFQYDSASTEALEKEYLAKTNQAQGF